MVRFSAIPARCKAPTCSEVYIRIGPEVRTDKGNRILASACSHGMRERELANASCNTRGVARAKAQLFPAMSSTVAGSISCATLGMRLRVTWISQSVSSAMETANAGNISIPYRVLYQECGHQSGMKIGTEP